MTKLATRPEMPKDTPMTVPHERIAMRAYERWCQRGCPHGEDMIDWLEAEAELRQEGRMTPQPMPRR